MGTEVPAYLLKKKLQNLEEFLRYERIACPTLDSKITEAINLLEKIRDSACYGVSNQLLVELKNIEPSILGSIREAEDIIDRFLLVRTCTRITRPLVGYLPPWVTRMHLARGLERFRGSIPPTFARGATRFIVQTFLPQPEDRTSIHRWEIISVKNHIKDQISEELLSYFPIEGTTTSSHASVNSDGDANDDIDADANNINVDVADASNTDVEVDGDDVADDADNDAGSGEDDNRQNMIPNLVLILHGERGSGKTTIVRSLYDSIRIRNYVECLAWVSIHENLGYRDVLVDLIQQIGENGIIIDHNRTEKQLCEDLYRLLARGDGVRYLIVLDNCTHDFWPKLQLCFPDLANGSRIIITDTEALGETEFNKNFHVENLSPEEGLRFLKDQVEESLHPTADMFIREKFCKFIPHLLVLLNGALKTQSDGNIISAMGEINTAPMGQPRPSTLLSDILGWSYGNLHPLLKTCFLYMGIFPKAFDVPVRRVSRLWLSEGFLEDVVTPGTEPISPGALVRTCFGILVNRKLIEVVKWKRDGSPKTCRIPTFAHSFAVETLKTTRMFHVYTSSNDRSMGEASSVRRVACHPNSFVPRNILDWKLRSYVTFHTKIGGILNEEIGLLLRTLTRRKITLLKVLDLEGVYKPRLPDSLGRLQFLRLLGLRSTLLDSVPESIGELDCLETLDLKHTNVTTLPGSIFKSRRLRHLCVKEVPLDSFVVETCRCHCLPCMCRYAKPRDLEVLTGLYIDKGVNVCSIQLGNIKKLEVTCRLSGPNIPDSTKEAAKRAAEQLLSGMTTLRSLKLRMTDTSNRYHAQELKLTGHTNLKKLYMHLRLQQADQAVVLNHPLRGLLPLGLTELTLSMSYLIEDPMPVLSDLGSRLVVLRLLGDSYMGAEMLCGHFPNLRVLKLWKLPNLERLIVKEHGMSNLREMEIRECVRMNVIVDVERLTNLEELVLTNMPKELAETVRPRLENGDKQPIIYTRVTARSSC